MSTWVPLLGGLALLLFGGELLVRGAVEAAGRLGVSPLVIGLTVVGFGTSTPELVTSVEAALSGSPGIAYGNIVGSNLSNILLILGLSALLAPIAVRSGALKRDGAVMVLTALAFAAIAVAVPITRFVGGIFLAALAIYIVTAFRQERTRSGPDHGAIYNKSEATQSADPALAVERAAQTRLPIAIGIGLAGLALVVLGGHFLVDGAVQLARDFAVPETVIGLTIVAIGTSMPELVTSVVAALRRQADVAFGNIVGSNIYNILGIGGATALIAPSAVPERIVMFDNPAMVAASLILVVLAFTGSRITRWEGALLLAAYLVYIAWLWPR